MRLSGSEYHHHWESVAGVSAMISPDGSKRIVWDLDHVSGPAQIEMDHTNAGGALMNGGGRYVEVLPEGMIAGPHVGANRLRI
jgi:hypothetical protein